VGRDNPCLPFFLRRKRLETGDFDTQKRFKTVTGSGKKIYKKLVSAY